jgi:hypothetical protein
LGFHGRISPGCGVFRGVGTSSTCREAPRGGGGRQDALCGVSGLGLGLHGSRSGGGSSVGDSLGVMGMGLGVLRGGGCGDGGVCSPPGAGRSIDSGGNLGSLGKNSKAWE